MSVEVCQICDKTADKLFRFNKLDILCGECAIRRLSPVLQAQAESRGWTSEEDYSLRAFAIAYLENREYEPSALCQRCEHNYAISKLYSMKDEQPFPAGIDGRFCKSCLRYLLTVDLLRGSTSDDRAGALHSAMQAAEQILAR